MTNRNACILSTVFSAAALSSVADTRPNILIILTDDSGYSDPGCYGGEIDTPNLDKLAHNGLRFKTFYNNARCSPTRASIMTGRYNTRAGFAAGTLGGWGREVNLPSYRARLPYELPTIAEVMKESGYQTLMTGKWHLGGSMLKNHPDWSTWWKNTHPGWELTPDEGEHEFNALPLQRGFDRFFGMIEGETHHFFVPGDEAGYMEGNTRAKIPYDKTYSMFCYYENTNRYPFTKNHLQTGPAFYATDGMTDRAIKMIRDASDENKPPFFMYVAYRAPHTPLQAPKELVDKYLLRYSDLKKVEEDHVNGLIREKLFPANMEYIKNFENGGARNAETERFKLRLAVHAAMMEKVDENVGRIVQTLDELGELDNTLIFYLSDNGASSIVGDMLNRPYRGCKALLWEGGAKTHCIVHWPDVVKPDTITDSIGWVGDFLPTCLEIAGGTYPAEFRGKKTEPLDGRSILPTLKGETQPPPEYLFFNDRGQQSVIAGGRWKLLINPGWYANTSKQGGTQYELYDLEKDPAEARNIAAKNPDRVKQLAAVCAKWQQENGILDYAEVRKMRPNDQ